MSHLNLQGNSYPTFYVKQGIVNNFTSCHAWMVHAYFVVLCNFNQLVNIWIVHMQLEMKQQITKKYKIVTYALKDGKRGKRCDLVIEKILIHEFMKIFHERLITSMQGIHKELDGWICNSSCAMIHFHQIPLFQLQTSQITPHYNHKIKCKQSIILLNKFP